MLLAKALIEQPDLLILDEPFEGLDANSQQQWLQLLQQLKQNITIVLVINRLTDVPVWADTISLLHQCPIINTGSSRSNFRERCFPTTLLCRNFSTRSCASSGFSSVTLSQDLQTIFDLEDVTVKYGDKIILNKLKLASKTETQHWWIKGPNGCGKSTLLSMINGDHPQAFNNKVNYSVNNVAVAKLFGKLNKISVFSVIIFILITELTALH